ncbi:hypothetical protein B0J14DRAFT_163354 [Halenospora varia]|nr:hypothetical protein B0J14DRAFT_163354 [Halenospora varia]
MATTPSQLIKIMMFIKKKPETSDAEFRQHWLGHHAKIPVQNEGFRRNVVKFNQVLASAELRSQALSLGLPILDYDGIVEIWVESLAKWKEVLSDEDFVQAMKADEGLFLQPTVSVILGTQYTLIGPDSEMSKEVDGEIPRERRAL